jgi:hypothetical protein
VLEEQIQAPPRLRQEVTDLFQALTRVAEALEVPDFALTVVLSGDLATSVARRGEPDFHTERVGGLVAGKTLSMSTDSFETTIVLDTSAWINSEPDAGISPLFIALAAHEYGHAMIYRMRAVAGTGDTPMSRARTPAELGAHLAVGAADEYRCDMFANLMLGAFARYTVEDEDPQPMTLGLAGCGGYLPELQEAHDRMVYPGWADLVARYRAGEVSLVDLYNQLRSEIESVIVLLARADAEATIAGLPTVVDGGDHYSGVGLYLKPAWQPIRRVLDTTPTLLSYSEFAEVDRALLAAGSGIADIWEALGLRGEIVDGDMYLRVAAPAQ